MLCEIQQLGEVWASESVALRTSWKPKQKGFPRPLSDPHQPHMLPCLPPIMPAGLLQLLPPSALLWKANGLGSHQNLLQPWGRLKSHLFLPLCHLANPETNSSKPTSSRKASRRTMPAFESCCLQGRPCRNTEAHQLRCLRGRAGRCRDRRAGVSGPELVLLPTSGPCSVIKSNSCVGRIGG